MLELQDVSKVYPGRNGQSVEALRRIDLLVEPGEFLVILGPSGSGKSTLLFTAGAMLRPTEGTVRLDGIDVYGLPASKRHALRRGRIGFMFQTFNLITYLSCLDNVALPAILDGSPRSASIQRAGEMLERLGLLHRIFHRPDELSVGERQRVALCRSLINQPDLLLADEPTGNLDVGMTEEVCGMLTDLHRSGQTLMVVTHDPCVARIATRTVDLHQGGILGEPCLTSPSFHTN